MHDIIIAGSGLFGSVVACEMRKRGKSVLVIDKRSHIGGNCWTRNEDGINVHEYGAHIFRTSRKDIWDYIRQFAEFNHFVNSPIARYHGNVYNMPFNMNTFSRIWNITTPKEAIAKIEEQRKEIIGEPKNLEEKAISLIGRDVYEILVKEYTEKQWGRPCSELPASIIRRLPVRLTYDNNYFNDPYQGIPIGGYTQIFEKMLEGCEVLLNTDYKEWVASLGGVPNGVKVLYTGPIDEYYDYCFGELEYRSLRFEHERYDETDNFQGVAVVNYTDKSVPYTRTIEHKHFEFGKQPFTIVSKEYPFEWHKGIEPYYPINDEKNQARYERYSELKKQTPGILFGGRLGSYSYTDMQDTIVAALKFVKEQNV
jgi:UDP-galactopyranose mutase